MLQTIRKVTLFLRFPTYPKKGLADKRERRGEGELELGGGGVRKERWKENEGGGGKVEVNLPLQYKENHFWKISLLSTVTLFHIEILGSRHQRAKL